MMGCWGLVGVGGGCNELSQGEGGGRATTSAVGGCQRYGETSGDAGAEDSGSGDGALRSAARGHSSFDGASLSGADFVFDFVGTGGGDARGQREYSRDFLKARAGVGDTGAFGRADYGKIGAGGERF